MHRPSTIHRASYRELNEQLFYNQSIYRLRRLDNQRTKTNAAGATGSAREFCWPLESDLTRAVWRFNLNHLVRGNINHSPHSPFTITWFQLAYVLSVRKLWQSLKAPNILRWKMEIYHQNVERSRWKLMKILHEVILQMILCRSFNPILDGVRATPILDGGGTKKPPGLTLPFSVWQQWNLVGIQYRPRTFQNNQKN